MSDKRDPNFGFTEEAEAEWREYLSHFHDHIYPMFQEYNISLDAALSCWFINRLRNAVSDEGDSDNELWRRA